MPYDAFKHIDTWVFDLDNTLYPPEACLFDQIERLMASFLVRELNVDEDEAHRLRSVYWQTYGTTLAGLMHEHDMDPLPFLHEVHQLDLSNLTPAPDLRAAILALPGRKIIYTNGSRDHAHKVSEARGLDGIFDAVYGVEDADFVPKPKHAAFDMVFSTDKLSPNSGAMFEDDIRNLAVPHKMGMNTVLVGPPEEAAHVHHQTEDLAMFLAKLV